MGVDLSNGQLILRFGTDGGGERLTLGLPNRLTEQPRRRNRGDRWAAFQYILPEGLEHLVAIFRLPGGEAERTLRLYGLDPEREYTLSWLLSDHAEQRRGVDLIERGLHCRDLPEEGSALLLLSWSLGCADVPAAWICEGRGHRTWYD